MEVPMKSAQSDTSLMWPTVVAAALLGMLAFMIVADPAAERPATSTAHTTN
jgi:hypothetical protein